MHFGIPSTRTGSLNSGTGSGTHVGVLLHVLLRFGVDEDLHGGDGLRDPGGSATKTGTQDVSIPTMYKRNRFTTAGMEAW